VNQTLSRRTFLQTTAAGLAVTAFGPRLSARQQPSDQIVLGMIGVGNMGTGRLRQFLAHPDVRVAAICDVDKTHAERAVAEVEKVRGYKPQTFGDFRRLLEVREIDAVAVVTPDHWHAIPAVRAFEAGKDVFVEKPLSYSVAEGRAMADADRVVTVKGVAEKEVDADLALWPIQFVVAEDDLKVAQTRANMVVQLLLEDGQITEAEANSYLQFELADRIPPGVTEPWVSLLDNGRAAGTATVDLARVGQSRKSTGILDPFTFLTGSLPVSVKGVLKTKNGVGTFALESAQISGVPVPAWMLQEIVSYYSKSSSAPNGVSIDKPFTLPSGIREIQLTKGQALVVQ
jgi:hypothetical protein